MIKGATCSSESVFGAFCSFWVVAHHKAAFICAAQKSQVAATILVLNTRHNNMAEECSLAGLSWHCGRVTQGNSLVNVQSEKYWELIVKSNASNHKVDLAKIIFKVFHFQSYLQWLNSSLQIHQADLGTVPICEPLQSVPPLSMFPSTSHTSLRPKSWICSLLLFVMVDDLIFIGHLDILVLHIITDDCFSFPVCDIGVICEEDGVVGDNWVTGW